MFLNTWKQSRRSLFHAASIVAAAKAFGLKALAAPLDLTAKIYESIGVKPVINSRGTFTIITGSQTLPDVKKAMDLASRHFVDMDELMDGVGARLAELSGAEWGIVTSGCAAAITHCTSAAIAGNNLLENVGSRDQALVEARPDVLVYTSEPLSADLEITGPLSAVLYVQTTAVDTDFTVKLCDLYPNGKSYNICEGVVRGRYRDSLLEPSLLTPGQVYELKVPIWPTSNCFRKGHALRVQVSSSNFPLYDRNTNAGGEGGPMNIVVAEQTVLHDRQHPSHLLLPVIP
jgi:hypothetical protein